MNKARVAILIPAYNECDTIRPIVETCLQYCKNILVVDDGSTDDTVAKIHDLPITILKNAINRGKDASLLRGFSHLLQHELDAVITIDADNQHNPDDIPRFLIAQKHFPKNLIIGARRINAQHTPRHRLVANKIADFFISWAAGNKILDTQSGYRLYPIDYLKQIQPRLSRFDRFTFESKALIDASQQSFPPISLSIVSHYPKNARQSYYRPFTDTARITLMITGKLLSRGLYLNGLLASATKPAKLIKPEELF